MKINLSTFIILIIILIIGVSSGIVLYFTKIKNGRDNSSKLIQNITNFADCAKAGYPVIQTFPAQCKTPDGKTYTATNVPPQTAPTLPASKNSCASDHDCTLVDTSQVDTLSVCCHFNRCTDYSKNSVQALSTSWVIAQTAGICRNKGIACPMIAMMCTKQITETQNNYQAKCIQNICQKIYIGK